MKPPTRPRLTVLESLAIRINRYRRDHCMLQHFQEEKGFEERQIVPEALQVERGTAGRAVVSRYSVSHWVPSAFRLLWTTQAPLWKTFWDLSFFTLTGCSYDFGVRINPDLDGVVPTQTEGCLYLITALSFTSWIAFSLATFHLFSNLQRVCFQSKSIHVCHGLPCAVA